MAMKSLEGKPIKEFINKLEEYPLLRDTVLKN